MRVLYPVVIIYLAIILTSCATAPTASKPIKNNKLQTASATPTKIIKDPITIVLYDDPAAIKHPFTIVGQEIIPKYNKAGIKRQEAILHDAMRKKAALMGGDAVINIMHNDRSIIGTVVAYQDIFI